MDIVIGFGIILAVLVLAVIYILAMAVKNLSRRLTETNKDLMIMVAAKMDRSDIARALVASNRPPQKDLKGISNKKDEPKKKEGISLTYGANP